METATCFQVYNKTHNLENNDSQLKVKKMIAFIFFQLSVKYIWEFVFAQNSLRFL